VPNLLATGGAGFIGANFTHHWLAKHPEDSVVLALSSPRLTFVQGDIRAPRLAEA
jgi:dTDP-glucose 4,6-dehydratase